jgi:sugar/nucleoside kinase (ribokinase family)
MKYDFITVGGATEDITFYTNDGVLINNKNDILRQKLLAFEYGAKMKIDRAHSTFGGGAANTAVCFSKLGFKTAAFLVVGKDDRGKKIINNLKQQKVETKLIKKIKTDESGFSFLLVGQNNEHIVFSNRAANSQLQINDSDARTLGKTEWVYLASLSGAWQKALNKLFSINNIKIAWNPGHIQLSAGYQAIKRFIKKTEVLLLNKDEAIELVISDKQSQTKPDDYLNNIKNLAAVLKTWGPRIVVITNGKYGADAYDGKKFFHQPIFKETKRIDTTGVGDAFNSSFVAGLKIFNNDIKKALCLGAKNSASVVAQQGAQNGLLSKNDIL